ncbi:DUF1659 domain-containing protein [Salsuginibacillus kocurii]|uniref:DUF1659 domain-containing protein n=1 Tax=Salsuginibacillus kocurii TaxID=427078 RepID=UPI00035DD8E0|nr:DUF1659 domain-containing protein [Salsuginibacillus kocurii]
MAITSMPVGGRLSLRLQSEDEFGEEVLVTRSYQNVRPDADIESVYAFAEAVSSISEGELERVEFSTTEQLYT